jgi:hypothetical protein
VPNVFRETSYEQIVHEIASPLIALRGPNEGFVFGSAFVIGRGIALTAYHVIADLVEKFDGVRDVPANLDISFHMAMCLTIDGGKTTVPLGVLRAWNSVPMDLAILAFGVPEDFPDTHTWKLPRLSLLPPKIGTPIAAFGFHRSEITALEAPFSYSMDLKPRTSTGVVVDVHHELRDRGKLPFPCFQTDARFDSGMSGGPIFDDSGHICGVVCTSVAPYGPGDDWASYGCSLWPLIGTLVDLDFESVTGTSGGPYYPALQLFQDKHLSAVDLEHVGLSIGPNNERKPYANYDGRNWNRG